MSDDLNAQVRERAYAIWERENRPEGKHLDHWLCAQAEIEAERSSVGDRSNQPASVQTESAEDAADSASEGSGRARKRSS